MRTLVAVAFSIIGLGCTHSNVQPPIVLSFPSVATKPGPAPIDDCNVMRLVTSRDAAGAIMRVYVRVDYGTPALMTFDTGSPRTRLAHDNATDAREIRGAGNLRIFCEDRVLDSLPQSAKNADGGHDGLPVIGVIGTDILDLGTIEVDAPRQIFALRKGPVAGSDAWTRVPINVGAGVPVADAIVDHTAYRLEFDTGGYRAMIFDPNADMSGPTNTVYDWEGNAVAMKPSIVQLILGNGAPKRVPLDRTTRYPVFEYWVAHAGVSGAIGISTIGTDHFTLARDELRLAPAP